MAKITHKPKQWHKLFTKALSISRIMMSRMLQRKFMFVERILPLCPGIDTFSTPHSRTYSTPSEREQFLRVSRRTSTRFSSVECQQADRTCCSPPNYRGRQYRSRTIDGCSLRTSLLRRYVSFLRSVSSG